MEEGRIYSPFYLFFLKKLKLKIEESRLAALHSFPLPLSAATRRMEQRFQDFFLSIFLAKRIEIFPCFLADVHGWKMKKAPSLILQFSLDF